MEVGETLSLDRDESTVASTLAFCKKVDNVGYEYSFVSFICERTSIDDTAKAYQLGLSKGNHSFAINNRT
jgi:hypothetical protein